MFTLPLILSMLAGLIVFIITARYINRTMAEKGIPSGMVRGLLVVFLASVIALFTQAGVDWLVEPSASTTVQETK